MWLDILRAVALVLVIEGLMPFLAPHRFRETLLRLQMLDERTLRTIGFLCVLVGLLGLELLNWFF
ncbi:MAG: DUF2065 domain-containing protein [Sinobacteraceae bacterium]|nr:DUF2065 domain-containing protein [Nevskiaceae bacterium]